jgi:uncharacterized membrane protein
MTALERNATASRDVATTVVKYGVFGAAALLTLATLYVHEAYVLRPNAPQWAHLAPLKWWLLPHILGGSIALLLGPLQFSTTLRRRFPAVHRWLGRAYVVAVVIAASLSLYIVLKFEAAANWWSMGAMGALWLVTTIFAWLAARNRNLIQHKLWIGRSYCLTFTFVATRFIPDVVLPGLDYVNMTALYWFFIVLSLIVPDLVVNGRALSVFRDGAR